MKFQERYAKGDMQAARVHGEVGLCNAGWDVWLTYNKRRRRYGLKINGTAIAGLRAAGVIAILAPLYVP